MDESVNRTVLRALLKEPRIQAFLHAIRLGEGTSDARGYTRLVGGGNFTGFADHPNQLIEVRPGLKSTAAGAYQFLHRTWQALVAQYHFEDFSPDCQDEGAVALIVEKAAQRAILEDRTEDAVKSCATIWASLPGSPYGQPTVTMKQFLDEYRRWYADAISPNDPVIGAPIAESKPVYVAPPPIQNYTTMPDPAPTPTPAQQTVANAVTAGVSLVNPVAGALLQVARSLWPEIKPLFTGSGSEVAARNVKAAEAVIGAVMQATGAASPAQAIEAISNDPAASTAAREAAVTTLQGFGVVDVSGVPEARKWNLAASEIPTPWNQPAVWFAGAMVPLIYMTTYIVINDGSKFGSDTRAFAVGAILGTLLGGMVAFFLGTALSSQRKDAVIAQQANK